MQTSLVALTLALFTGLFFLAGLSILNLLYGAVSEVYFRPQIKFLKSNHGEKGLSFAFYYNRSEKIFFDRVKLKLLNPHTTPAHLEIYKDFHGAAADFARDLEIGFPMENFLQASRQRHSLVEMHIISTRENVTIARHFKGNEFVKNLDLADKYVQELNNLKAPY